MVTSDFDPWDIAYLLTVLLITWWHNSVEEWPCANLTENVEYCLVLGVVDGKDNWRESTHGSRIWNLSRKSLTDSNRVGNTLEILRFNPSRTPKKVWWYLGFVFRFDTFLIPDWSILRNFTKAVTLVIKLGKPVVRCRIVFIDLISCGVPNHQPLLPSPINLYSGWWGLRLLPYPIPGQDFHLYKSGREYFRVLFMLPGTAEPLHTNCHCLNPN